MLQLQLGGALGGKGFSVGTPPATPTSIGGLRVSHSREFRPREDSSAGKDSPMPPLGLPPTRVDTDEDLMQKQVMWEVNPSEIDFSGSTKLGAGAYGEVIRAKWRGTPVAIKKVNVGAMGAIRELRHEIAVMSHMHHPRVVQFLGACTRSHPWLIMFEYLPGGALSTLLEKREGRLLPLRTAGRWALDTAQGLRYLHEHKPTEVVHRDLKPNNLLVDASGHVKISDFGLAKVLDAIKERDDTYVMTGETGSYRYMAPEVFRHEKYSNRVDIYALGMIMYYLFHGYPPFYDMPPLEAAKAAALEHKRPAISARVNKEIGDLITICWAADPVMRPSAEAVCTTLERVFPQDDGPAMDPAGETCACSVQ